MNRLKMKATTVFTEMIDKNIDSRSQSLYKSTLNKFKHFLSSNRIEDSLDCINSELLDEFVGYLVRAQLQAKTIHNYEGAIITLINYANSDKTIKAEINLTGHKRFEDKRSKEQKKSKQVPLTEEQLNAIYSLKGLTPKEEEARDIFVCQCLIGQRISDLPKIFSGDYIILKTSDNIEIISFCVQKTGEEATLYLFPIAKEIILKYREDGFRYFNLLSNDENVMKYAHNELNRTIKSVCKKADLSSEQNYATQVGNRIIIQRRKLYELVHTQTARHTFITLMCKLGVPKEDVIIATAHTDTKMIDNVYLHETTTERGQRLLESYREIRASRFFAVEKSKTEHPIATHSKSKKRKLLSIIVVILHKLFRI